MNKFCIKEIKNCDIVDELAEIGFDVSYRLKASEKYKYKNLKIFSLSNAQANILKQTALSFGADCAVHRDVITGKISESNVILGGSYNQLRKISDKLKKQPFSLSILANEIEEQLGQGNTQTKIVGILNITDNSFSDGGDYFDKEEACKRLKTLIEDGVDIIDIGAESTKPGAGSIDADTQIQRIMPVLEFIKSNNITTPISIDTRSSIVAEYSLQNGATIINDVSGLKYDEQMAEIIAKYDGTIVIQHSINKNNLGSDIPTGTYQNVIEDVFFNIQKQSEFAKEKGIKNIIIDVGIGFDKTLEDNFKLFNRIDEFKSLGYPIMLGISRKSMLQLPDSDNDVKDVYTLALNAIAIEHEIDYIRVHNVKMHRRLIDIYKKEMI